VTSTGPATRWLDAGISKHHNIIHTPKTSGFLNFTLHSRLIIIQYYNNFNVTLIHKSRSTRPADVATPSRIVYRYIILNMFIHIAIIILYNVHLYRPPLLRAMFDDIRNYYNMRPPPTTAPPSVVAPNRGERVNQVFDKYPAADTFPVGR